MGDFSLPYLLPALMISVVAGAWLGYLFRRYVAEVHIRKAEERAQEILEQARERAVLEQREAELKHKDLLHKIRADFENETEERKRELTQFERRLLQKEVNLDKRMDLMDRKADEVARREAAIAQKEQEIALREKKAQELVDAAQRKLEQTSGLTREAAAKTYLAQIERDIRREADGLIQRTVQASRERAKTEAREIIVTAIERFATEHTADITVTPVHLPSDEMKARVIGKEGRNIRTLEKAAGVDIIIDDAPSTVLISAFDPARRQVARMAMERLVADGRIHPARVEEAVIEARRDLEESIRTEGEKAAFELGIHDLHPEIVKLLGRLKFRTSYGQNVLEHSKETAHLMANMAAQLDWDVALAKRIGLLHDVGKAVSHEVEGTHAAIGGELAKKYGESPPVVEGIAGHHDDEGCEDRSLLAVLCQACDALSAARPGARGESPERYLKRLEKLEQIANSFQGVEKSFAIQAGREIRVIVRPGEVAEGETHVLARELSLRIQKELSFPGEIKVMVIRETRSVEYAHSKKVTREEGRERKEEGSKVVPPPSAAVFSLPS